MVEKYQAPNVNMRRVKFMDGVYTIDTAAQRKDETRLCDHCGALNECKIWPSIKRVERKGVSLRLSSCDHYLPILSFRKPLLGLEAEFNTFRLGKAWAGRVQIGRQVTLMNVEDNTIIGQATVQKVAVDKIPNALKDHAAFNHMTLGEKEPEKKLREIVRGIYGKHLVTDDRLVSVIYLARTA